MKQIARRFGLALCAAATLAVSALPGRADVQPGDVINKTNIDKVKDLVSPGVEWCIKHGLVMKIVPYKKIEWNKEFREATEKYGGQTKLGPDGRTLVGHVAGMPFPNIDANDPQVALKIMWNFEYKPYTTDDEDLRNFDADTGPVTDGGPMNIERHFLLDHLRTLWYNARLIVDPKPELPNPDGVRAKSSLHPILEPFDLKGVGETGIRYLSPDRQDDTWLYLPSLRRVRRLSSAQRSDALFGQDTDVDSYGGYAGQIPWFDWKYLGEKEILGSYHSDSFPVKYCDGAGDFIFCDTWEKRKAYVIEGTPRLPQYAYGKRLIFIDKETYTVAFTDIFDRSLQLWKVWVNQWSFKKRATSSYGIEYTDEMPYQPSITMVDMQLSHATKAALPSSKYPGEEGWYYNQGAKSGISEEFFTVAHLIASGN
ncbi:MAG TPA: DUF1329 domain-containing protein [Candidatus Acidoferrales bacterium]|nr:DUF1329 domain-containing protein [Candidatus Acidoferrales bacterium]